MQTLAGIAAVRGCQGHQPAYYGQVSAPQSFEVYDGLLPAARSAPEASAEYSLELEYPMATRPSPEKCAREILAIFVSHFGLLAGEVLRRNSFITLWPQRGYSAKDFEAGLQFAIESGWLELLADGKSYRLTRSGFTDG
ncbi:MAG: hypothetical protein JJE42_10925 [Burkholderiales bacterium]|nr:hypothetical protein [Burkholderiales bacterium]